MLQPSETAKSPSPGKKLETLTVTDNRTGKQYEIPIENDTIKALDLRQIKVQPEDFGMMTYDPAFMNTAACKSKITFIDGDKGILRYRGYPIEQLAEKCSYLEVAYLLIHGELPNKTQLEEWTNNITTHTFVHESMKKFMDGFHYDAHPMGMFVSSVAALSTFYPSAKKIDDPAERMLTVYRLIGKVPTLAAFAYRHSTGMPYVHPDNELSYAANFLNMMFRIAEPKYSAEPRSGPRARCALYPACRPRAELQCERDAKRGQLARRSVQRHGCRSCGALWSAPRWCERGSAPDAG